MPSIEELESQAAACSQRGDVESTRRVCNEILALDENHLSSLHFLADLALQEADFASAAMHLQALRENSPGDLKACNQLGQALYRQGKLQQALAVYEDAWRLAPRKGMIYLTIGCLHLELGDVDKAAQVFSLGESVDRNLLFLWKNDKTNPALARMSKTGWDTLCRHHTQLHIETVEALGDPAGTARIRDALWPLVDTREVDYDHPQHRPQLFCIRFAESPTFFDAEAFHWRERLELAFPAIRDEILAGLDVAADGRPYLGDGHRLEGELWEPLVNRMSWASVHLYKGGVANQDVIAKFPKTLAALEQVPLATSQGNPAEVFVSVLAPHTRIPEHYGVSSAILTAHLPIEVPPDCGLKVHGDTRAPEAGKLMVFDDTWQHSAWNDSDSPRVVLIFELWHPDLTAREREAVLRSIEAREQWFQRRRLEVAP